MKRNLTTLFASFLFFGMSAQSSIDLWQEVDEAAIPLSENSQRYSNASRCLTFSLDFDGMANYLRQAPVEFTEEAQNSPLELALPMPDGNTCTFAVREISIMEPGLAEKYPTIKTYAGFNPDAPEEVVRITFSEYGFNATVFGKAKTQVISPYTSGQATYYTSFFEADIPQPEVPLQCGNHHGPEDDILDNQTTKDKEVAFSNRRMGDPIDLKTYRLALATTVEFSSTNGLTSPNGSGTLASVMARVTTVMNQVNGIYERDNAIRLIMIDGTDATFFFGDANDDPYTNANSGVMLVENVAPMNDTYGLSAYDIGHVFGTAPGGGVVGTASLGSVCLAFDPTMGANKAAGASNVVDAATYHNLVSHEMGHQFNATHTFNLCDGENETASTGYEPGGGSFIMSYGSVCGSNAVQQPASDFFHINSLIRINDFTSDGEPGGVCKTIVADGNRKPDVSIPTPNGFFIPISTPFELTGEATDEDGDDMTYSWEQYNLGPESPLGSPIGNAPSFRGFEPVTTTTRVFPRMQNIVDNVNGIREVLPTYSRDLNFRFTARDNASPAGAWSSVEIGFEATDEAGPFLVQSPNTEIDVWEVGSYVEVTWDVANTDAMPVNCQTVNIRLSLDGGFTYPIMLLPATPNDGTAFVTVPDEVVTTARVRVEAADNIFFDISNNDFSIVPPTDPGFAFTASPGNALVCLPEDFEVALETSSLVGFSESINMNVTGLPAGAVANFSANPIAPGDNATLTLDMSNATEFGAFDLAITAEANGLPTAERLVSILVVSNDISALQLLSPPGASGTGTLPAFEWTPLTNALSYNVQIATDAAFTNIVAEGMGLPDPSFDLPIQLESNTVYFWHVSLNNECGMGEWSFPGAFKTLGQVCTVTPKSENTEISQIGTPTITSTISLASGGEINDVNIVKVKGQFDSFSDFELRLEGPAGEILLMPDGICTATAPFDFGLDDEAPSEIPCAPDDGERYKPAEPLSFFDGSDSQGDWTLTMKVTDSFGTQGGIFEGWELEVCGLFAFSDPYLVTNEKLGVPPNETNLIFVNTLEVADDDNVAQELTFTIVDDVESGYISVGGTQLGVGGQFTMTDVYSSQVTYTNTDGTAQADNFSFIVEDPDGGFLGTPVYEIEIDENAIIGAADELLSSGELLVFPNPTSSVLNIAFKNEVRGGANAMLFNAQGQLLKSAEWDAIGGNLQMGVGGLPAGFHLLQVSTENGIYTKKVMIE